MVCSFLQFPATASDYENLDDAEFHYPTTFPGNGKALNWFSARALAKTAMNDLKGKKYRDAVDAAEEAVKIYPFDADFQNLLAVCLWQRRRKGDFDLGLAALLKALDIRSDVCIYWDNLGKALAGMDKLAGARNAFVKASKCGTTKEKLAEIRASIATIDEELAKQASTPGPSSASAPAPSSASTPAPSSLAGATTGSTEPQQPLSPQ